VGFTIDADGGLSGRRVWADLGEGTPGGICADAEDTVWYADVPGKRCLRVAGHDRGRDGGARPPEETHARRQAEDGQRFARHRIPIRILRTHTSTARISVMRDHDRMGPRNAHGP